MKNKTTYSQQVLQSPIRIYSADLHILLVQVFLATITVVGTIYTISGYYKNQKKTNKFKFPSYRGIGTYLVSMPNLKKQLSCNSNSSIAIIPNSGVFYEGYDYNHTSDVCQSIDKISIKYSGFEQEECIQIKLYFPESEDSSYKQTFQIIGNGIIQLDEYFPKSDYEGCRVKVRYGNKIEESGIYHIFLGPSPD